MKSDDYIDIYTTVLSIKNSLENRFEFEEIGDIRGKLNGFDYVIKYKKIESKRNFIFNAEDSRIKGNIGPHLISLYQFKLNLKTKNRTFPPFTFYLTRFKRVKTRAEF